MKARYRPVKSETSKLSLPDQSKEAYVQGLIVGLESTVYQYGKSNFLLGLVVAHADILVGELDQAGYSSPALEELRRVLDRAEEQIST